MTPADVLTIFTTLEDAGLKPPARFRQVDSNGVLGLTRASRAWSIVLGDVTMREAMQAAMLYMREGNPFFPIPGQLLLLVPGRQVIDDADESWGLVQRALQRTPRPTPLARLQEARGRWADSARTFVRPAIVGCGSRDRPASTVVAYDGEEPWAICDDAQRNKAIHAAVDAVGGWHLLAMAEPEDVMTNRHAFRNAYRAVMTRGQRGAEHQVAGLLLGGNGLRLLGPS